MTEAPRAIAYATPKALLALIVVLGALLSMFIALNIVNPGPGGATVLAAMLYVAVAARVAMRPFAGYLILAATMIFLAVYAVNDNRYLNSLDLFLPVLLPVILFGSIRREAIAADRTLVGPAHDELRKGTRSFAIAGILYLVLCLASMVQILWRFDSAAALEVTFSIARCTEGALMLPLGLWLLRTEKRIEQTITVMQLAGLLFAVVNILQVFKSKAFRAGMTWVVNHLDWPVEAANEAGATMVIMWALIMAEHQIRPRFRTYPLLGLVLFMVFLTQSRSGLLALVTFVVLSARHFRWKYLLAGVILAPLLLKLVPPDYLARLAKSVTMERGTFEVYSILIRVYGYQSATRVFLDNWLFGVGYLGLRYISHFYNDLSIAMLGAENFYLETAAGLGIIGLAVVGYWYARLFQLGRIVKRVAPAGTRGAVLARAHLPLMVALSVANLTGNNFMGLIGVGQLMLWAALLIRSGHLAIERGRAEAA